MLRERPAAALSSPNQGPPPASEMSGGTPCRPSADVTGPSRRFEPRPRCFMHMPLAIFAVSVAVVPTLAWLPSLADQPAAARWLSRTSVVPAAAFKALPNSAPRLRWASLSRPTIDQTRGEDLWESPTERPWLPVHCCWAFRHPQPYRRNPISGSEWPPPSRRSKLHARPTSTNSAAMSLAARAG